MGNQNSSAFPIEEIRDSATQQQFLYSIDSQNPKNAQPISPELLDFNKQTNNFVLFTYGEMDFVHYWRCQNIFVAAFAAPESPIPERSYHYHTFKGMPFITIRCNKNCYQVMNHYMDHARLSITRTEFLNKVISEIDSQNAKDLHENKIKDGFNEAPQIRRASPSKNKRDNLTTSLAPSLTSIKRNQKFNPDNEDHSIELPKNKRQKVSIQLPTLDESSPHFANTIEMITYDSVNVSTSFTTTDKNISDYDDAEEEKSNHKNKGIKRKAKPKNKQRKNQNKKNKVLLESDEDYDAADNHEMLSENSEEEYEEENNQKSSPQKQMRSNNKILTQNKETGSVQSKLDNRSLSFANGSDAARSASLVKRKKKATKKSRKLNKSKKKSKKTGKKAPENDDKDAQAQNIQSKDNQIQQPFPITKDININQNENNNSPNNLDPNNKFSSNNANNNNINQNNNTYNSNNNKFNSKNAPNTLDSNKFNSKGSRSNNTGNNDSNNYNNNFNSKNSTNNNNYNTPNNNNNNFNSRPGNNSYANDNFYNPNGGINNSNKYDNNSSNIQPRIKKFLNYDKDDIIDSDDETNNQPTNSRPFNKNDKVNQLDSKGYNSQGNQAPIQFNWQQNNDRDSDLSYSDYDEEEDNGKVVKINLKYTNTPDSNINNVFGNREPKMTESFNNDHRNQNEIEEEEEVNTQSSQSENGRPNLYNSKTREPNQILTQKPAFQISDSTGVSFPKGSKESIQISDPVTHSRLPEDGSLIDKGDNQILHFSLSNPLEVCKSEDKNNSNLAPNQSNSSRMQVTHLVEISKFNKPKPKIEISPIVDISLPESDTTSNNEKPENKQQKGSKQNQSTNNRSHDQHPKNDENDSDYDYEYFTVLDDKNNNQPIQPQQKEPLVAILTRSPLSKPKKRRHHHHHHETRIIEKEGSDYNDQNDDNRGKRRHRKRKHHHRHHNNNNSDNDDYNNDYDSDNNNNRKNNSKHRSPHRHRKTQTRKQRNIDYSDEYEENLPIEKVDKSIQPTADKSTQLRIASKRTVATSTSFFDKDTKQSQTRESILNKTKEKVIEIEIDYKRKRNSKITNTNNEEFLPENNKLQSDKNSHQKISQNNKRPQNEKNPSDKVPSQNIEKTQPIPKQKVTPKTQNKKVNKNNNEYDDYNYNENEDENENIQKNQPKNNNKTTNSTIDSSGWSAALNTISGLENDKATNPDKVTSRFIKNNNPTTNSTISKIDDTTDGSLVQKLLPTNQQPSSQPQQQQQHNLQKTKIFPLPENKDSSLIEEEEDIELDENQSSSGNLNNEIYQEEEEEESDLTGTINEDDEFIVKSRSSRTQSSASRSSQGSSSKRHEGQIKNIENIEPITSKSSEVSQFDIFNSDKDNKNRSSSSSSAKKKQNKQICLKKFDNQRNPDSDKFNEFSGSTGTTSSDIGDLETVAKGKVISESSSSSSRNHRKKISSAFSSEFEAKDKSSDFTTNAFEAFSTDSSQNYPSFNEISEKIQQASLVSCDSLKT